MNRFARRHGLLFVVLALAGMMIGPARSVATPLPDAQRPREMLLAATSFSDRHWDEAVGLCWSAAPDSAGANRRHGVRESAWYSLGLLMRDAPGDRPRALRILDLVLSMQLTAPGQRWDGTFRRFIEEPVPGPGASTLWKNFDPNWRHFIGTTFVLILENHSDKLPPDLRARLLDAIRRAVEGELTQGRDEPYHTNIKLMHGFLWSWAGARLGKTDWVAGGERWLEEVAAAFAQHETFEEYNSPTYYGVDFYGLALARRHGATERIRMIGARLEAGLWRDVARFYHADLRNLAGPFDRAYGMDMRRYVSLTGAWMALALPAAQSPLPDPTGPMGHAHDFVCIPTYVALGAQIPAEVLVAFTRFEGERLLRRPITEQRIATAWIARNVMIGGEITGGTFRADPSSNQFHPATIHWRLPDGDVGWLKLHAAPALDAEAARETLTVSAPRAGELVVRVYAPGATPDAFTAELWRLPGLTVLLEKNAGATFTVTPGADFFTITFRDTARLVFRTPQSPRLAVVIAVDQLRADYLERFRPWFVEGGLNRLLTRGAVFANAHHPHALNATAPGHATLLTGVSASTHGIIANEWFDPAAGRAVGAVEDPTAPLVGAAANAVRAPGPLGSESTASPRRMLATTLGDQLKLRFGDRSRVIALANKDRGAIFLGGRLADAAYWMVDGRIVSSRFYLEKLPAWVDAFNAEDRINRSFGHTWDRLLPRELYDTVQGADTAAGEEIRHGLGDSFPRKIDGGRPALTAEFHNAYRLVPHGLDVLADLAAAAVRGEQLGRHPGPDLLAIAFSTIDYSGHSYGPDSHEIMDGVLRLDRALAGLFAFLDGELGSDRYVIVLSSDHGVSPLPERVQNAARGVAAGRLDWPTLHRSVEDALTTAFGAPPEGASWTIRDSYGYRLLPAALAARKISAGTARAVIKETLERNAQVADAWTRDELLSDAPAASPHLAAWRMSYHRDRSPDVVFTPQPYFVDRTPFGTNHGTPYDYDSHVPLLFAGPGISPRVYLERVSTHALAPTLARLLGVPRPPQAFADPLL